MALWSSSRPGIRARVLPRLPATLAATGGLAVEKANGVWTFSPDWTVLAVETTIDSPEDRHLWTLDPNTGDYTRLSVQALIDNLPAGPTGATGATGATSGIKQAYSTTTADADPGAGTFRLNNATPASATAAYLDNVDSGGSTVSAIIDLWDDSTTTTKGYLRFEKSTDPTVWAQFAVTGSVVDGTGYRKVTLGSGAASGSFTNGDTFAISFYRSGDKGADGAGTGDMLGANNLAAGAGGVANAATAFANIKQAASDTATGVVELATDAETITGTDTARAITPANLTAAARKQGLETISIPASAMWPRTTNGPSAVSRELTTGGDIMIKGWAFDTTTEEAVQFYINFPKSWNKGTITFRAKWTNTAGLTTETVSWGLSAGAFTDDDPLDTTNLGTEVQVSDTWLAQNDLHTTAVSGAVTVGNTPIDGDLVIGQIARSVANDNMTGDAELMSVEIFFTTSAATDA